jgi:membrane protease YdiL (CAAX protease family)
MEQEKTKFNWVAFLEVVVFVELALLSKMLLDPIFWRYSGPVSLIGLLVAVTIYTRFRSVTWAEMGLKPLSGVKKKLLVIPQALLTFVAFGVAVGSVMALGSVFGWDFMSETPAGVEDRWGDIRGNLQLYILWLGIVWTAAAFGEEMFFRGFLITRLEAAFAGVKFAPVIAIVLAALFFGYGHMYYQGMRGFVTTGAIALAFGAMFIVFKRNLWPLILVHGIVDTISFSALYFGWEQ